MKAEKTRKYIIEKAAPIFNMKGYEGTSLSDLTRALGMTKGAIYGNFKNKDEIAIEAFLYNINQINDEIKKFVKPVKNSCDKLIAFSEFYFNYYKTISKKGGCPLLNGAVDSDDGHPELKKKVKEKITSWQNSLIRIVETGINRNEIKKDILPKDFAVIFISLIEGGIMLAALYNDKSYLAISVNQIKKIVNNELRK